LIDVLKIRFHALTQKNLKIFGLSTKSLKDYVTSERDQLRKISRMPTYEFRLWEEDIEREERKSPGGSIVLPEDDADAEGFYDDFVIVEKLDMKKYNKQEKILEEQKKMVEAPCETQCLIAKPGFKDLTFHLEDFKIKKVIDKGSFGKVFLVVC